MYLASQHASPKRKLLGIVVAALFQGLSVTSFEALEYYVAKLLTLLQLNIIFLVYYQFF